MFKTEFYEAAVSRGFYGLERSGLYGIKDNVRKYWEDISIKLLMRPYVESLLNKKNSIRIVDLGCGSGEGYELLTHIPENPNKKNDFILSKKNIEIYHGLDISTSMLNQGKINYKGYDNVIFEHADLSINHSLFKESPFDIYFSSYASLSHLSFDSLLELTNCLLKQADKNSIIIYDLLGRYSPEWPIYWHMTSKDMLSYNMAYLLSENERESMNYEIYPSTFWDSDELSLLIEKSALHANRNIKIHTYDRSMFVGRHMDTGIFNNSKKQYRYQVNRLFDRDYRGEINELKIETTFYENYESYLPEKVKNKLKLFSKHWNIVIYFLDQLMNDKQLAIDCFLHIQDDIIAKELEMLAWLYNNSNRFPVVDFWASVMGPQIACVLRNLELDLTQGFGCGHGLVCIIEVL